MCSNGCHKTFVSRTNQSGCTFRVDCNCWACVECRRRLEADWNKHAADRFASCLDGIGYLCVQNEHMEATMKRLARAKTQYVRVRGHGIFHIYTSNPALGQKRLTEQQAVEQFAEHLSLAPSSVNGQKKHVISTSRGWRHASRGEVANQHSDYISIGTGLGTESIRSILDRLDQSNSSLTDKGLSFRFQSAAALESFVCAVADAKARASRNLPYNTKRVAGDPDKRPQAATGSRRLPANPAFEALRSP